jgi:hypothetical protein
MSVVETALGAFTDIEESLGFIETSALPAIGRMIDLGGRLAEAGRDLAGRVVTTLDKFVDTGHGRDDLQEAIQRLRASRVLVQAIRDKYAPEAEPETETETD